MRQRTVASGGIRLAVTEYGDPAAPPLIAVHGFPDNQRMWEDFAHHARSSLRVVTYDVRGAGRSSTPARVRDYGVDRLTDDLLAVMDAVSPQRPVHLLGHDWGSVQLWEPVMRERDDPRLRDRIASYTSISGPCLGHFRAFLRSATPAQRLHQMRRSWYVAAFQVPWIPELVWRHGHRVLRKRLAAAGQLPAEATWGDEVGEDGAHGINLYRANMWRRSRQTRTRVPVQLVVPLRDPFVTPALAAAAMPYVQTLHQVEIDAGHWLPRTHPTELAELVTSWATQREPDG